MMSEVNTLETDALRAKLRDKWDPIMCWVCHEREATDVHHLNGDHTDNRPENLALWCKRCHNEHHGISDNLTELGLLIRQYYGIQKVRMQMGRRVSAYGRLGYDVKFCREVHAQLLDMEKRLRGVIRQKVADEPVYDGWLKHVRGIGHILSAAIITRIGSIDRFATVSKLWAYSGLDVEEGRARRKRKGEVANWDPELRALIAEKVPASFIKLKGTDALGRRLYEQYKAFYTQRDGEKLTKLHIERRARRKVGKVFLACLWVAWRELEGLPVTEPYVARLDEDVRIVRPEDWLED